MRTVFLAMIGLWVSAVAVAAETTFVPPEVTELIRRIEGRPGQSASLPRAPAKITVVNDEVMFLRDDPLAHTVRFDGRSGSIVKHITLRRAGEAYAFQSALQNDEAAFQPAVGTVNGQDALFFFNGTDVFAYTQVAGPDGGIELKEWIYALKPNAKNGSEWAWVFRSEPWQWPLTIEMHKDATAAIKRHLPFAGVPIEDRARSQFLLDVMVRFKRDEPVKTYFPFSEEVAGLPAMRFTTREGVQRDVDVSVVNSSVMDDTKPRPKHGLDFGRWDEYWLTVYKMGVKARAEEYPLLIE